jgi:RNA polymerase sigma-70 factor (ECF subfamily)
MTSPGSSDPASFSPDELERLVTGDRHVVTAFTQAFLPRVYGLTLRISRSRELAEDATQETFVRALRALPGLKNKDRLASWVLTIAANTVRELAKKRPREAPLDHDPPAIERGQDDDRAVRQKALALAVSKLETDERELFLLHTVEGLGLEDLALERQTSAQAMKSRLHRIRAKVRSGAFSHLRKLGVA